MAREDNFDLINLDGPLTVESILKTLQQRFMDGHCYVSLYELTAVNVACDGGPCLTSPGLLWHLV